MVKVPSRGPYFNRERIKTMEKRINDLDMRRMGIFPGAKRTMIKSERRKVRHSIKAALRAGKEI